MVQEVEFIWKGLSFEVLLSIDFDNWKVSCRLPNQVGWLVCSEVGVLCLHSKFFKFLFVIVDRVEFILY